jgi:BirA family biotin operon repressor/biotin-[acetyl-CoA-carboxylase] ligase
MQAPNAAPGGPRHIALGTVESTNDEAMDRAIAGADLPLWVSAERQTMGSGRQRAHWASEKGYLYASIAVDVPSSLRLSDLPIVASVALFDAICFHLPDELAARLSIKWPNDILLAGRKVSGILAESQNAGTNAFHAVVGFGVNLTTHPAETRYPATDFAEQGVAIEPELMFRALAASMGDRLDQWQGGQKSGFAVIRTAWLARASGLGGPMDVRLPGETLAGTFQDMDGDGRLVLRLPDGDLRTISAGEVFFARVDRMKSADGR